MLTYNNMDMHGSFRDPSGFVFLKDGVLYRQINAIYKEHYDLLMGSGLYDKLVSAGLLIPHYEVSCLAQTDQAAYKIIKPELIPFISYPFEWCFSQLKHAALMMLKVQKIALQFDMTLKDGSAYNIQFMNGKPLFVDTLSFEKYRKGQCWSAYRQFCTHFLAPLALMSYVNVSLNQLLRIFIDGIPLDVASSLLPLRSRLKFSLFSHIHLHARIKKYYEAGSMREATRHLNRTGLSALIDNLELSVQSLKWKIPHTEWANYYKINNYSPEAMQFKQKVVSDFLDRIKPKFVFDCGANIGVFSRLASAKSAYTVSFDSDYSAVEQNYLSCVKDEEKNVLPLMVDLTNPSSRLGWDSEERMSFFERGPVDTALALALIHHLVISNNVPFQKMASFFKKICNVLIIEFIPKTDPQAQELLATREDILQDYTEQNFEEAFGKYFTIERSVKIEGSPRTLYLLKKKT